MHLDARGLPLSTASVNAAAAFEHLITGYLTQRADTPARLNALLEVDPDFALAHCMKGYFAMLAFKQAVVPSAVEAARTAQSLATGATPREHGHIPAWSADIPGYASMLGRRSEGVQWLTTLAPNWEGSHTQQDVLEQLFVDAALKAGSTADIRLALERVAGRRAILVMMALSALPASADQNFQL